MRSPRPPWPAGAGARFRLLLATCGGAGFSPLAPGLAGSLVGLALVLGPASAGAPPRALAAALALVLTPLAIWAGGRCARDYNLADPSWFVLDEAAGMATGLACGPGFGVAEVVAALTLFRVLDVVKPPPIRQLERLPGGLGITADDIVAGAVAGLLVRLGWRLAGGA